MPLDQPASFDLPEATRELRDTALAFAQEVLAPKALEWDQARHFPVAEMRQAAELGMAALYVREESGGAGLTGSAPSAYCPPNSASAPKRSRR